MWLTPLTLLHITWVSLLGSERSSVELQCTNCSQISNCLRLKSAILLRNIYYNINLLLRLYIGTRIKYILIYHTSETYWKLK